MSYYDNPFYASDVNKRKVTNKMGLLFTPIASKWKYNYFYMPQYIIKDYDHDL